MPVPHDPDEGLWGRVLLALLGVGLVGVGLLLAVMLGIDEDAGPDDHLYAVALAGAGFVALVAAAIGRAFGRWALALLGVLLLAQAVGIASELVAYREAPDTFTVLVVAVLVVVGFVAVGVAWGQIFTHRRLLDPSVDLVGLFNHHLDATIERWRGRA